jgi:CRP/FNR family cyclic AMP-dependent transcriptional regulator
MNTPFNCIKNCELFKHLSDSEVKLIAKQATIRKHRKNTIIISVNDSTDSVYIIESGKVRVYKDSIDGRQITLNTLGPGMVFGELAALSDAPRAATVETLEETQTRVLTKADFIDLLKRNPDLSLTIARKFAQMVHVLSNHVADIALLDVYGRLTNFLERVAVDKDGQRVIEGFTHQELANNVGSSREMVSRILSGLKKGNYISSAPEGRSIILEHKLPSGW